MLEVCYNCTKNKECSKAFKCRRAQYQERVNDWQSNRRADRQDS